ncbi:MAG TPA: hypothetical protein VK403_09660 [Allosphingosinicella sp.]|nr:hypothetical protein [Allosphingosinicella sp.]
MKTIYFFRAGGALCLLSVSATIAGAQGVSDPAPIVSAFNETCRRGFPDLETISQRAQSQGWIRRSVRLIAEESDPKLRKAAPPEFLQKDGMTLVLSAPNKVWNNFTCGISVSAENTLDTQALAQAVSAALDGAQASVAKERGAKRATWHVKSGFVVKASVSRSGRIRTANLAVQTS